MSKPKLIYLEWIDAIGNSRWFTSSEALDWAKNCEWMIREVGWLIYEDDKILCFASSWKVADEYTGEQFGQLHQIPKAWIRNRKMLKI